MTGKTCEVTGSVTSGTLITGATKNHVQVDEESNELMKWVQRKFLSMFFIVEVDRDKLITGRLFHSLTTRLK